MNIIAECSTADTESRPRSLTESHTRQTKRVFDFVLSGLGLLLSSPAWLLIATIIKLEDGGPVFYSQERVGQGGRRFRSWKFRSMVPNSDEVYGPLQAKNADARVTRVGGILRAPPLDE